MQKIEGEDRSLVILKTFFHGDIVNKLKWMSHLWFEASKYLRASQIFRAYPVKPKCIDKGIYKIGCLMHLEKHIASSADYVLRSTEIQQNKIMKNYPSVYGRCITCSLFSEKTWQYKHPKRSRKSYLGRPDHFLGFFWHAAVVVYTLYVISNMNFSIVVPVV